MSRLDFTRRDMMRLASVGMAGASQSGWMHTLAASNSANPQRKKSVIMLWLNGGPATIDMWDLKPGHKNGGPFQETETAVPGIKISEHLPRVAKWMKDMVIVRSMSSKEGDHDRATHLVRTGYVPQGAIQFPAMGAVISRETGNPDATLPGFVSIAPGRYASTLGSGFLGPRHAPLAVGEYAASPDALRVPNLEPIASVEETARETRMKLLSGMEKDFNTRQSGEVVDSLQAATARAVRLMKPEAARAFRLEEEKDNLRDSYGRGVFGQGCLLACRLVERGVPFVEVTIDGWDTHADNFDRVKGLSTTVDLAFSSLLNDLKDRGLLESTLVVCMGEFGRTPKINGGKGRDHWPASWASVMAGGGIKGGQVVGTTSADGTVVEERPVKVQDLIATVCKAIGVDHTKQNLSNVDRPIRIADVAAKPIEGIA